MSPNSLATNVVWVGIMMLIVGFVQCLRYAFRAKENSKKRKWLGAIGNLVAASIYLVVVYSGFLLLATADIILKKG